MGVILLNGVFVVNTGQQTLVSDVQQCHSRGFIDATAFRFDNAVFNLIAHAQTVATANTVSFQHQLNIIREGFTVQRNRMAAFETHGHFFSLDFDVLVPELHAHDRVNDLHAGVQEFQVFRFVRCTQHVGVCGIGFLD
ncbi:Uncharacterised protein [Enterobacter cloacae]|uniref:Uncharacterized protein n=1 Tax=Enterobacter cloacae TaxID=550 RepID=A0A156X343_ENTCL|nr:Uncharacterised protein [Enterobacter cloacae]SAG19817.1 Uncharacterised protein [Enterobacter cloacae]